MKSLGIDIGTTSICLVCYEEGAERLLFTASRQNAFLHGTFEQDPEAIMEKIYSLLEEAENSGYGPDCVSAVGISSQMHGILYVDGEGRAVSPFYTWKDEKGKQFMTDGETYEAYLSKRTGIPLFSGYGTVTHFFLSPAAHVSYGGSS